MAEPASSQPPPAHEYVRFGLWQRVEHLVLLASFTTLAVTGLVQKFASAGVSEWVVDILGGIESTRLIHRWAAIVLMLEAVNHVIAVLYRVLVRRVSLSMLPLAEDVRHVLQDVMFSLGRRSRRAYYGRYSYAEKVEYLAVVWGTILMAITGFMMWNPIATVRWLPGEAIPAAKAAHGAEAILAALSILLWHFYHVHLRHLNRSMFTGKLSREEMESEHPSELASIEAGRTGAPPPPALIRRRQRVFIPVASVLAAALLFGVYRFVTFEETAITTAPPGETAPIFVPQTSTPAPTPAPSPTPASAGLTRWTGEIATLLGERCGACHGSAALAGLNLTTYEGALQGGLHGPAVVPGDPDASLLVQIQQTGGHPGQLTEEELAGIIAWIRAGAPDP